MTRVWLDSRCRALADLLDLVAHLLQTLLQRGLAGGLDQRQCQIQQATGSVELVLRDGLAGQAGGRGDQACRSVSSATWRESVWSRMQRAFQASTW